MTLAKRARNTGCIGIGLYGFALFFAVGAVVSFFNVDIMTAVQGALLTALFFGVGIYFARRHYQAQRGKK